MCRVWAEGSSLPSDQGILFCTSECLRAPPDLLQLYLHESTRVYRDKLVEEKDFRVFDKLQADAVKKFYEVRIFKVEQTKIQGWRKWRESCSVWTWTLVSNLQRGRERRSGWFCRGWEGMLISGPGVRLSESALSDGQIGKHFNGFLLPALASTLPGCSVHARHATVKNLTSVCVHTPTAEPSGAVQHALTVGIQSRHLLERPHVQF